MPRTVKSYEEVQKIREEILEAALQCMIEDGFDRITMRKVAEKLDMTAANIYNYYANKDKVYLAIQSRGFELLYERFYEIYCTSCSPQEKLEKMIYAFLHFGITTNRDYYEIMFNGNTPKYSDYVGTSTETAAFSEKQIALKNASITMKVIDDIITGKNHPLQYDTRFYMMKIWITLNGFVNLYNSRVLQEVDDNTDEFVYRIIGDLLTFF